MRKSIVLWGMVLSTGVTGAAQEQQTAAPQASAPQAQAIAHVPQRKNLMVVFGFAPGFGADTRPDAFANPHSNDTFSSFSQEDDTI